MGVIGQFVVSHTNLRRRDVFHNQKIEAQDVLIRHRTLLVKSCGHFGSE